MKCRGGKLIDNCCRYDDQVHDTYSVSLVFDRYRQVLTP